jgi:hypothetical protein
MDEIHVLNKQVFHVFKSRIILVVTGNQLTETRTNSCFFRLWVIQNYKGPDLYIIFLWSAYPCGTGTAFIHVPVL